jgi:hypothetical protein
MRTPERYHADEHPPCAFADCWFCQRDRACCRSKLRFGTREEVDEWVRELNESRGYAHPVVRYRCRWCQVWHMKTARDKRSLKRAEKHRRKWLRGGSTGHDRSIEFVGLNTTVN